MSFKILDGTRPDKRLCDSCDYGHVIKGPQQGQEKVYCTNRGLERLHVPFPVVECSDFCKKNQMTEYEAKQIGWVLEVSGGKTLGFKPPKKEYPD